MLLFRRSLLMISDIIIINLAIFLSFIIQYEGMYSPYSDKVQIIIHLVITLTSLMVYLLFDLYSSLWKYASLDEMFWIVFSCCFSILISSVILYFHGIHLTASHYVNMAFINVFLLGAIRISYRVARRIRILFRLNGMKEYRKVMIIGAGEAGAMVIRELQRHPEMGLKPVVIIDDDPLKRHSSLSGIPIRGSRESIVKIVEDKEIDEIIVAIPSAPRSEIREILNECKKTRCKLKILPGVYELIDGKVTTQQIRDVQIEDLLGRDPIQVDLCEIAGYLEGEVVLVTGGGGSIGSELCRQIARFHPRLLLILDIYENNAYTLQQELLRSHPELQLEVLIGSVRDKERLESIFAQYRPGVVFHAAAHKHVPLMETSPGEAVKNNIFGTLYIAECADKYKVKRFVLISSDKAVNPTNVMGATKRVAEMIIQAMDRVSETEFVAVRFGNVLGSNGSVVPLFKQQIAEGGPVTVTHPEINRYFMTIPEAVQLVIQAGAMAKGGEIFILDMGKPVRIVDLARDLIRLSGYEPDVDIKIEFTGLRPGEKLYEELLLKEEGLTSTKHEKIYIGKPMFHDIHTLKQELEKLKFALIGPQENLYDFIERLVPTYQRASELTAAAVDYKGK